jgi:Multicopper oxidase
LLIELEPDHRSAFLRSPLNPTVLLGGIGNLTRCQPSIIPTQFHDPFTLDFQKGKKYLLRVINTAYDSAFLFSIDNHKLTVVSADFVPVTPSSDPVTSIAVQIGQRYNVIVEADPQNSNETDFWIRTYVLSGCHFNPMRNAPEYMKTGIIRYDASSTADPKSAAWGNLDTKTCRDEAGLVPTVPWYPKKPVNSQEPTREVTGGSSGPWSYPWAFFAFETPAETGNSTFLPMRVDWQNITFLNLDNKGGWPLPWIILPEAYSEGDWVCWSFIDCHFH